MEADNGLCVASATIPLDLWENENCCEDPLLVFYPDGKYDLEIEIAWEKLGSFLTLPIYLVDCDGLCDLEEENDND